MTLYFTPEEQKEFSDSLREVHFYSKLGFANSTNGFRRGCMHLFIAGSGAGKSTLTRTLIRDLIFEKKNNLVLGLWLSEESIREYKILFSLGSVSHEKLLSTEAYSEQDNHASSELLFFEWLEMIKPDVLIYDNITTSKFYMDKRPDQQSLFATKLKNAIKKLNCAALVIAHADSQQTGQRGGLLDINNIRGSKTIVNLVEFAYLVQTFKTPKNTFSTLRIAKSRSQNIIHDTYLLNYNSELMAYVNDTAIPFEKFKEVYNERNRL